MNFFERLGFRKADEMDIHMALIAVRSSWLVIVIALLIWSIYDVITKATITMPLSIVLIGVIVYFSTDLYMRKKLGGGHQK